MRSPFLPAKPAQFLPGKQIVSDWRRAKIQEQATAALAATGELESWVAEADDKISAMEDVVWTRR